MSIAGAYDLILNLSEKSDNSDEFSDQVLIAIRSKEKEAERKAEIEAWAQLADEGRINLTRDEVEKISHRRPEVNSIIQQRL